MAERTQPIHVGAPAPELKTSLIVEELDEDYEAIARELSEDRVCFFNSTLYREGAFVCSGTELLRCERGAWVREGGCDPDNP